MILGSLIHILEQSSTMWSAFWWRFKVISMTTVTIIFKRKNSSWSSPGRRNFDIIQERRNKCDKEWIKTNKDNRDVCFQNVQRKVNFNLYNRDWGGTIGSVRNVVTTYITIIFITKRNNSRSLEKIVTIMITRRRVTNWLAQAVATLFISCLGNNWIRLGLGGNNKPGKSIKGRVLVCYKK